MSKRQPKYYKEALDVLKAERGKVNTKILDRNKYRTKMVRAVSKSITSEVKSIPDISEKLPEYNKGEIFRSVMHLMKYGGLKMVNKRGVDYPEYAFEGGH